MSDELPERVKAVRDALLADIEASITNPLSRDEMLDGVRKQAERITGQPCIAMWDGDKITIQTPVLRLP